MSDHLILSTIHSANGRKWQLLGIDFEEVRGRNRCGAIRVLVSAQLPL